MKRKPDIFSRRAWIRYAMIIGATILILLFLPKSDHESYTYELNQPWRYPLLTAEFDMPILRDSTSAKMLRDSIDSNFIPFVRRNESVASDGIARFAKAMEGEMSAGDIRLVSKLLAEVYSRGVVDPAIYKYISGKPDARLRVAGKDNGASTVRTISAHNMCSPAGAFEHIDSLYLTPRRANNPEAKAAVIARALNTILVPNVTLDTVMDAKFRDQEYISVNAALGVIKKGQRIVDRGEIITPQIYTNLNTYMEILDRENSSDSSHTYFLLGQGLYIFICLTGFFVFLATTRWKFYISDKKMVFLISFITIFTIFSILMSEYLRNGLYYVPFAAVPVVIAVFFDSRTAIFSLLVTVMICTLTSLYPWVFLFLELAAGLTAAFSIQTLTQRSQLLRTAALTFVAYVVAYIAIQLVSQGDLDDFQWRIIGAFAINSVVLSFVYVLVLVIEKIFGFTSSVTLVELSDINNPLLRRLAQEAPGTFQHSMQVSTLAAEAARAIGANTQLVRTGALYHDIGKLDSPIFFTENQHGVNPHSGLDPRTSAHKIISHVTGGLAIAQHAKLPTMIRDFISEHHGRSLTRYFYNTAVNENGGEPVDKAPYTYPGPNPQSRETAILMMADSVEAASRSLKDYSAASINALVDKIIDSQMAEGLFNESPISFRDIQTIKDTFKRRLATIYHSRVAYPDVKKKEEQPAEPDPAQTEEDSSNEAKRAHAENEENTSAPAKTEKTTLI